MDNQRPDIIPAGPKVKYDSEGSIDIVAISCIVVALLVVFMFIWVVGNALYKDYTRNVYMEKLGCQKVEYYNDVPKDWHEAIHDYSCPPNVDWFKASYGRPE